jgi:hypothetical protein
MRHLHEEDRFEERFLSEHCCEHNVPMEEFCAECEVKTTQVFDEMFSEGREIFGNETPKQLKALTRGD